MCARCFLYRPLDTNFLFAKFADIAADKESFARWADEYGLLAGGENFQSTKMTVSVPLFVKPFEELPTYAVPAESLSFWREEHRELHCAVTVWEAWHGLMCPDIPLYSRDEVTLNNIISWYEEDQQRGIRITTGKLEDKLPLYIEQPKDAIAQASVYLRQKINIKLKKYPVVVNFQMEKGEFSKNTLQPSNLLSAMWYQLLRAVKNTDEGIIRMRRCRICKEWVSLIGRRVDWQAHEVCHAKARKEKNKKGQAA